MQRKKFLKNIFGASLLLSMDGFSSIVNALSKNNSMTNQTSEIATFGAVHLNNTSIKKAIHFWTKIVGMKLRQATDVLAEFGSEDKTLVVVHQTAKTVFKEGYSGLYHFAIHAPNKGEFARMLYRLIEYKYPCSPTDHTMSKSVYLNDPDGITIEFTLETPERFKRVVTVGGLKMEDKDGTIRTASAQLNVEEVLKDLPDKDISKIISNESKIGHFHLYVSNVEESNTFYKKIGFLQFNDLPQYMYADVGAGGHYQHRVAMNSWHGRNKPLAPKENAGMRHYQIIYETKERLQNAIHSISKWEEKEGGYWVMDPTGHNLFLTHK
jgi:catechol 2,3-dioxygenase